MDDSTTVKRTRTEQCQHNAHVKSEQKHRAALEALRLLHQEHKPVTKAAVAKRAGVSVVFLRSHPDLVQAIEEAEQSRLQTPTTPSPDRTYEECGLEYASFRRNPEALLLYQQHSTFLKRERKRTRTACPDTVSPRDSLLAYKKTQLVAMPREERTRRQETEKQQAQLC